jgi:hypothetical protein
MNRAQRRAAAKEHGAQLKARPGSANCCPRCKSRSTTQFKNRHFKFYAPVLSMCLNCRTAWEPIPDGERYVSEEPNFPFHDPCDNCAIRKGSWERERPERWAQLAAAADGEQWGAFFYCHKGVPIAPESEHGFDYPLLKGKCAAKHGRLCRGFLNAKFADHKRQREVEEA